MRDDPSLPTPSWRTGWSPSTVTRTPVACGAPPGSHLGRPQPQPRRQQGRPARRQAHHAGPGIACRRPDAATPLGPTPLVVPRDGAHGHHPDRHLHHAPGNHDRMTSLTARASSGDHPTTVLSRKRSPDKASPLRERRRRSTCGERRRVRAPRGALQPARHRRIRGSPQGPNRQERPGRSAGPLPAALPVTPPSPLRWPVPPGCRSGRPRWLRTCAAPRQVRRTRCRSSCRCRRPRPCTASHRRTSR